VRQGAGFDLAGGESLEKLLPIAEEEIDRARQNLAKFKEKCSSLLQSLDRK